jgi:Fe-S oxidoreductase
MARLKAEFMQHFHDQRGVDFGTRVMAHLPMVNRWLFPFRQLANPLLSTPWLKRRLNSWAGISKERTLPTYSAKRFDTWFHRHGGLIDERPTGRVMLLADEFTNFYDSPIGIKTVLLLHRLGYGVVLAPIKESGRTQISKGFVRSAGVIAKHNLHKLKRRVTADLPLVGIEPSTVLTFRDEYPDLVPQSMRQQALDTSAHTFTIEEFLHREMKADRILSSAFTEAERDIQFHAHCYQKSLSDTTIIQEVLSFPKNYTATEIPSGCCGMAGGFGYEEKHYHLSLKIGELTLFPHVRETPESTLLVAPGHSCRHQIKDGTQREAVHSVEVLFEALL